MAVRSRSVSFAQSPQQQANLQRLQAGNRPQDQGALQTIQNQIQETAVVAPFDGIVLEKYADVGSFVSPSMMSGGNGAASSSSLLNLTSDRQ